jgi:predicted RNA polymerase sigma factor
MGSPPRSLREHPSSQQKVAPHSSPCHRLGPIPEALEAYGEALEMSQLEPENRLLQRRIQELKNKFCRLSIWARLKRL